MSLLLNPDYKNKISWDVFQRCSVAPTCLFESIQIMNLRGQGGSRYKLSSKSFLGCLLIEESDTYQLLFTSSKNIVPSRSYDFLKIWVAIQLLYARELQIAISQKFFGTIHSETIHARNLKLWWYLPWVWLYKSGRWNFEIFLFGHLWPKNCQKCGGHIGFC